MAEKTLRDAAKIDPNSHQTWYNLGKVLESLGEMETANDCMATALEVENSNPILPVSSIGITFEWKNNLLILIIRLFFNFK